MRSLHLRTGGIVGKDVKMRLLSGVSTALAYASGLQKLDVVFGCEPRRFIFVTDVLKLMVLLFEPLL